MLPDFPSLKRAFERKMVRNFEARHGQEIHVFNEVSKIKLHEGKRLVIVLENGDSREVEMKELRVEINVSREEYERLTPAELGRRVEETASEMARKQLELAYKELDRAVTLTGNVVDARNTPLSPAHILKGLEIMQIDFDTRGRPKLPTVIVHPDMFERYKQVLTEIESTPALKSQFAKIMADKKEEWRARESARKLVG